jgi:hypothetical protein
VILDNVLVAIVEEPFVVMIDDVDEIDGTGAKEPLPNRLKMLENS